MTTRKLAAVWFADIVGYTELSAKDEEAALRVVSRLQTIARKHCAANGGRLVKLIGDAVLAYFDSVDGATRAAIAVRDEFLERSDGNNPVSVRVGLHVGEVAEAPDGDIYGDAVNVASRLESQVAEPGQVVISDTAHGLLRARSTFETTGLGLQSLKGLPSPIGSYTVELAVEAESWTTRDLVADAIAPLQLLDLAGLGASGEVFLARDSSLQRTLAVKVLRSELVAQSEARARFRQEALVVASLSHPNIVSVHSIGELRDGTPFFVMEYVSGGSLADRVSEDGPLSVLEARNVLAAVAGALRAAHERGVVHRDIKASNVFYDVEDGRVLVGDWGIASLHAIDGLDPEERITQSGAVVGTPQFMSPEQLAADEVGPPTDIYSFGLLAFELLTGAGPYRAKTPRAQMIAHLRDTPTKLSEELPSIDPDVDDLVDRCLQKEPDARPTATELVERLGPGSSPIEWPPPGLERLRHYGIASVICTAVMAASVIMASKDGVPLVFAGPLAAISTLFTVAIAIAAVRALVQGTRLGYPSRIIADALADLRGDSGHLHAGTREYGGLEPKTLRRLVTGRRLRYLLLVTSLGFLAPAAALTGPFPQFAIALPALGLLVALISHGYEEQIVLRRRRVFARRRADSDTTRALALPWGRRFEVITRTEASGRGAWVPAAIASGLLVGILAVAVLFVPVLVGGIAAPMLPDLLYSPLSGPGRVTTSFGLVETDAATGAAPTRLEAGETVWSVLWLLHPRNRALAGTTGPTHRWDPWTRPQFPFPGGFSASPDRIIEAGFAGLSPAQQDGIRGVIAHPLFPEITASAHAEGIDLHRAVFGANTPVVLPPVIVSRRLDEIGQAFVFAASLEVSLGQMDRAEVRLRELLQLAVHLSASPVDLGVSPELLAEKARLGLRELYRASGELDASAQISDELLAVESRSEERRADGSELGAVALIDPPSALERAFRDEGLAMGDRWWALSWFVSLRSCESVPSILAGRPSEVTAALAWAEDNLAVHPEEQRLLTALREWPRSFKASLPHPEGVAGPTILGLGRISGRLLGKPEVEGCSLLALLVTGVLD